MIGMKIFKFLTILLCVLFFSNTTKSQEPGFYLGYELSNNKWDTGVSQITGATLDEEDTGYGIVGGFGVSEYFDIEFGYRDYGETSLKGEVGDAFTLGGIDYVFINNGTIKYEGDSYFLGIKPKFTLGDFFSIFGKLGIHSYDTKLNVSTATTSTNVISDGEDPYYGIGFSIDFGSYAISEHGFLIEASYNNHELDDDDIEILSVFVGYKILF